MSDAGFGYTKKFSNLASNASEGLKKEAATAGMPGFSAFSAGTSNARTIKEWATTSSSGAPKSSLTKVSELSLIDPFINWKGLDLLDFTKRFSYEFVIFDEASGGLIDNYIFPINPQNISMSIPSAVNTTVTMKGILEEHNSAPLRMITISGTTGISTKSVSDNASKPIDGSSAISSVANFLFKDTIKAAKRFAKDAESAVNAVSSAFGKDDRSTKYYNSITWSQKDYEPKKLEFETGYKSLHNLARFFDFYLAKKKTKEGKKYRLVFHMYKDKMYYDVTLNNFNFNKAPGTLEYSYNIALTAWKRRSNPAGTERKAKTISIEKLKKLDLEQRLQLGINAIKKGRKAIAAGHDILKSIKGDVSKTFGYANETILLAKDTVGLGIAVADLVGWPGGFNNPDSIWAVIKSDASVLAASGSEIGNALSNQWGKQQKEENTPLASGDAYSETNDNNRSVREENGANNDPESARLENEIPLSPQAMDRVFSDFSIESLGSSRVSEILNQQLDQIRLLTSDDLREKRDYISDFANLVSYSFSESANRETGLDISNLEILYGLNELMMGIDAVISAMDDANPVRENDYNKFYRDFAISNGLDFENSASKFYVPFPYGSSLESLAHEYLGDPNRWIEIASINGLKAPYIDEEGFEISLLSSAMSDSVTVANSKNLYIGQIVEVLSDAKKPVKRKIRSIDTYSAAESIIIFEAEEAQSLFDYKLSDQARLKVFLPNTINSLKLIAIPSQQDPTITGRVRLGAQPEDLSSIARTAKTDFLLNDSGDIVFTSGGDVKTASGLTNLMQAALIKLRTKLGSLLQHPEFGAGIEPGSPTAEVNLDGILESIKGSFAEDPRFSGILSSVIEKQGSAVSIKILLGVAGSDSLLPLETSVPF